jgi:WD40 repeat protein
MLPDGKGFLTTRRDGSGGLSVEQWSFDGKLSGPPIVVIPTVPGWRMAAVSVVAGKIAVTDGKKAIETFPLSGPAVPQRLDVERHAFDRMQFSPDGKFLVTFSWPERISVWNISTGGSLGKRTISQGSASAVVISPDSRLVASAGDDNIITVQEIQQGAPVAVLRGHKAQIRALAFSPDGKTLASSSADQTLRLWHCATWREMGVLQRGAEYTSLAFVGSPPRLVAIGPRGRVVFEGSNAR